MKRLVILVSMFVLIFSFTALIGCQNSSQKENSSEERIASTPPLQPAGHEGRYEGGGAALCYGCHGAGDLANPMLEDAIAIPENHYVDSNYDNQKIDNSRFQCLTCHPNA